jgi:hypothetical protein
MVLDHFAKCEQFDLKEKNNKDLDDAFDKRSLPDEESFRMAAFGYIYP